MLRSANLTVKGTRHYSASAMLSAHKLVAGSSIALRHQPDNRYDKNAVEVVLEKSGAKLGHVPKEMAPKYLKLIHGGKIASVKVKSAERLGDDVKISINVSYIEDDLKIELLAKSKLSTSARDLPAVPGVYAIKNVKTACTYIGSSTNVRDRLKAHIKDLSNEAHFNDLLQSDFCKYGPSFAPAKRRCLTVADPGGSSSIRANATPMLRP